MLAIFQFQEDAGAGAFGQDGGREQRSLDDVRTNARCGQPDLTWKVREGGAHAGGMALYILRICILRSAICPLATGRRSHLMP